MQKDPLIQLSRALGIVFFGFALASCGGGGSSNTANVISVSAPSITTQPSPQSVVLGNIASFSVVATGTDPLNYQWRKNGADIPGANGASHTTPVTTLADNASNFAVVVSNSAGSVTSNSVALTVTSPNKNLLISEVSSCYYINVGCWFEVYNPTAAAIDLSKYQLKSTSADATSTSLVLVQTFTLPSFSVPAGGYAVIAGNAGNATQRSTQQLWVRSGNRVPYWTESGFIELLSAGATVDFVRFGASSQVPVTASGWSGSSATALSSAGDSYNKSIVRDYRTIASTDNNSASDWTAVNWATPGGRNDVPAGTLDADNDGIPDSAEVSGGTFAGLDLFTMGARTGQRDIFIEVDYMNSTDPGVIPRSESLQKVVESFAAQGISVHFDAGTQFSAGFAQASFNLGQGSNQVAYEPCVTFDSTTCTANTSDRRSVWDWKDTYFDLRRRAIFHYLLFGSSQLALGGLGSSGLAELPGNDLIVTMGNWPVSTSVGAPLNQLINMQASTIMHELGHNLGLGHGGNESTNYKPNYWSVMNYIYQLRGLDAEPSSNTAYLRWRSEKGDRTPTFCALANSPCGSPSQFLMSYSNGSSAPLDESSLSEANNVGRGATFSAYADWDMNGLLNSSNYSKDLNGDGNISTLTDFNDWGNLKLAFSRYFGGNAGVAMQNTAKNVRPLDPITQDKQPVAEEQAPPQRFFDEIRRVR